MALQQAHKTHYLREAKKYGIPETHPLVVRVKRGDELAAKELDNLFKQSFDSGRSYDPYGDERFGVKRYGDSAIAGYVEPEGSVWSGKDAWRENVPTMTPDQMKYVDLMRQLSGDTLQRGIGSINEKLDMGFLDQLLGKGASKGLEGLIGEYGPAALGGAFGTYASGGGIGDILSSLIGSAIGQYGASKIAPAAQNIYNQGIGALGDLWNNRGEYRR